MLIQDTGCGIPKDKLVHITEAFYRIDKARSRSFGGAGLGLSLCDRIAKIHNGSLSIESEVGVGTVVKVQIRGGRYEKVFMGIWSIYHDFMHWFWTVFFRILFFQVF